MKTIAARTGFDIYWVIVASGCPIQRPEQFRRCGLSVWVHDRERSKASDQMGIKAVPDTRFAEWRFSLIGGAILLGSVCGAIAK